MGWLLIVVSVRNGTVRTRGFPHIEFGSVVFWGRGETGGCSNIVTMYLTLLEPQSFWIWSCQTQRLKTHCRQTRYGKPESAQKNHGTSHRQTQNCQSKKDTLKTPPIRKLPNQKLINHKPPNKSRRTRSCQRFAVVGVTKRWTVSRLEDTKPSTAGKNGGNKKGHIKKVSNTVLHMVWMFFYFFISLSSIVAKTWWDCHSQAELWTF